MNYVGILAEESGALRRAYVDMFRDHLASVEAHLQGKESEPLLPSFVPPAGYWTSAEKEAFFHALSIHSRLRPDLIAQSIGTKTVLDVCAYIDILDSAAAELGGQEDIRAQMDAAMHVSRYWQMWEKTQATALIAAESRWRDMALAAEHDAELAAKEATVPVEISEHEFLVWKTEKGRQRASEAVLEKLDAFKLKILDTLYVDEQCESVNVDDSRGLSLEPHTGMPHNFDDEYAEENTSHANDLLDDNDDNDNDADELGGLSPRSKRRVLKRMYMRRKRAELKGTDPLATSAKLKPGRQPTKRPLHSRSPARNTKRRRLAQQDATDSSSSEDDAEDMSDVEDQNEADQRHDPAAVGDEEDLNDRIRHPHRTSTHQRQKARARDVLQSHGLMSENTLQQFGLDLFHLRSLSHLIKTPDNSKEKGLISANTIRLLKEIVTDFTMELVHQSVVAREQAMRLKNDKKVSHSQTKMVVAPYDVFQAAERMGVLVQPPKPRRSRSDTVRHSSVTTHAEDSPEHSDYLSEVASDSQDVAEEEDTEDQHLSEPLYDQMNIPFFHFPPSFRMICDRDSKAVDCDDDDPDDDDALNAELKEEDLLDKQDCAAEQVYLQKLWELSQDPTEV